MKGKWILDSNCNGILINICFIKRLVECKYFFVRKLHKILIACFVCSNKFFKKFFPERKPFWEVCGILMDSFNEFNAYLFHTCIIPIPIQIIIIQEKDGHRVPKTKM